MVEINKIKIIDVRIAWTALQLMQCYQNKLNVSAGDLNYADSLWLMHRCQGILTMSAGAQHFMDSIRNLMSVQTYQ